MSKDTEKESGEGGVVLEEGRPKLKEPTRYAVLLLNDNYTTMEFVVEVLKRYFHKNEEELWSYDVAHSVGLTLEEEYELLTLMNELQRQEYLKRHLLKVIPVVAEMESLKEKIKLNGHFKNISGFKLS